MPNKDVIIISYLRGAPQRFNSTAAQRGARELGMYRSCYLLSGGYKLVLYARQSIQDMLGNKGPRGCIISYAYL